VDADSDAIAACRERGLNVEQADLFEYLERQPGNSLGGVFCSHVVEHLPPARLPRLIALIGDKLSPGGVLAIETPNPNCLAIFAGDFFLDPTHVRPVPSRQLHFYFEECGLGQIEIRELHPASALHPELAALDGSAELRAFRDKFFGGLDYAIIGRKLPA
jgi:O-antigen chain-terminating methyltransferase